MTLAITKFPKVNSKKPNFEFEDFIPRPFDEIRADFEKTEKYSKKFIDSLMKGLARSSFYEGKKT